MKRITVLLLMLGYGFYAAGQSLTPYVVASTGNFQVVGDISLGWTLGEPVIQTISNSTQTLTQGFQQLTPAGKQISGIFRYDNSSQTLLDNMKVVLTRNGTRLDSVLTDATGFFRFSSVPIGTYQLSAFSNKTWSGVNGTDALKIQRHFAGLEILSTPVRLLSADVNLSNSINGTDALKVKRRFAGLDNSFTRGDWTFAKPTGGDTVIVNGSNVTQDFQGLCVGDVNGSNIPSPGKWMVSKVQMEGVGIIEVSPGQEFDLPIFVKHSMNLSAISLVIPYPAEYFEVVSVHFNNGNLTYNILRDEIRFVWSELDYLNLKANDELLVLKMKATDKFIGNLEINLDANYESEFADETGETLFMAHLTTYTIKPLKQLGIQGQDAQLIQTKIFPNPASDLLKVEVESGKSAVMDIELINLLGVEKRMLKAVMLNKGDNKFQINTSDLTDGVYFILLNIESAGVFSEYSQRVVIFH